MIARIFSFILLSTTLYTVSVFAFPDFSDHYGNPEWNKKIRSWKSGLELYGSGSIEPRSIIQSAADIAKPYIDESQKTIEKIQNTATDVQSSIDIKSEQVKKALDSAEQAIKAVDRAKLDLQNTLRFSS